MDSSSPQHATVLLQALLENADDLWADAALLREHGRWARAYALAALAAEELGKVAACLDTVTGVRELPGPRAPEWVSHKEKLGSVAAFEAAFLLEPAAPDPDGLRAMAEGIAARKLAALYVDGDGGVVRWPRDVGEDEASELVDRVGSWLGALHAVLDPMTPEVVAAMGVWGPQLEALVGAMFDEADVPASLERAQRLVRAAIADDPDAVMAVLASVAPPGARDLVGLSNTANGSDTAALAGS